MIGPHEGKELELMLEGKKDLAVFFDTLTSDGISEEIIPENAFTPYVASGKIIRCQKDFLSKDTNNIIRVVCFTTPGNLWRADFIFWAKESLYQRNQPHFESFDAVIGQMLGYEIADIEDFLHHQKKIHKAA